MNFVIGPLSFRWTLSTGVCSRREAIGLGDETPGRLPVSPCPQKTTEAQGTRALTAFW